LKTGEPKIPRQVNGVDAYRGQISSSYNVEGNFYSVSVNCLIMSLIKEAEDKSAKGRGRLVLLDSLTPRLLGLADKAVMALIRVPNREFLDLYEDALRSNYKIFNLLNKRESVTALRVLGISNLPERIEAPPSELRLIMTASEVYLIDVDPYDDEPLAVYRLMVKEG